MVAGLVLLLLAGPNDELPKPADVAAKVREAQVANRRSLRGFRWSQREEVFLERERRAVRTFLLELDGKGALKSTLQSSALVKPRKPKFRIVETNADRKRDKELIAWVERAEETMRAYVYHDPGKLARALERAELERGTGSRKDALVATSRGFLDPRDHVRVWIDPKTWSPTRLEYRTRIGGDGVRGWIDYERLEKPDVFYARGTELDAPGRKIRLRLQNREPTPPEPKKAEPKGDAKQDKDGDAGK